jgi:S-adenosylmethionine decarboxylase
MEPMICGREWVVEAFGCLEETLRDPVRLETLFTTLIDGMNLHPVAPAQWHRFPAPGGITGMSLLSESHIAVHTFPEHGSLCLDVFCCRPRPDWDFAGYLQREFGASHVDVRALERPLK